MYLPVNQIPNSNCHCVMTLLQPYIHKQQNNQHAKRKMQNGQYIFIKGLDRI